MIFEAAREQCRLRDIEAWAHREVEEKWGFRGLSGALRKSLRWGHGLWDGLVRE